MGSTSRAGVAYFGLVFGAGFVFGTIRTLWLVPAVGTRAAELIEAPLMLVVIVIAAHCVERRFLRSATGAARLIAGIAAASLVLIADLGVGVLLRGMSAAEVLVDRDPVAGAVYYGMLVIFAIMPWWLGRQRVRPAKQELAE